MLDRTLKTISCHHSKLSISHNYNRKPLRNNEHNETKWKHQSKHSIRKSVNIHMCLYNKNGARILEIHIISCQQFWQSALSKHEMSCFYFSLEIQNSQIKEIKKHMISFLQQIVHASVACVQSHHSPLILFLHCFINHDEPNGGCLPPQQAIISGSESQNHSVIIS